MNESSLPLRISLACFRAQDVVSPRNDLAKRDQFIEGGLLGGRQAKRLREVSEHVFDGHAIPTDVHIAIARIATLLPYSLYRLTRIVCETHDDLLDLAYQPDG